VQWELFLSVYAVIFLAELPDKSTFTSMVLAGRSNSLGVFVGSALALAVQTAIAVTVGTIVLRWIPPRPVHVVAGLVFFAFAILLWRRPIEKTAAPHGGAAPNVEKTEIPDPGQRFLPSMATAFGMVFLAEWGDMTQIATAAMAAKYQSPFIVFAGAVCGLWSVSALASLIGNQAGRRIPQRLFQRLAAIAFTLAGLHLLLFA
jgi:Ca2+/H+ antiporter, TMEM165/GDT1 family